MNGIAICPVPTAETQLVLSSNVHLQEGLTSVKLLLVNIPSRHPWSICSANKSMSQIPHQSLFTHCLHHPCEEDVNRKGE